MAHAVDDQRLVLVYWMIDSTERRIASLQGLLKDGGSHAAFLTNLLRDEQRWLASLRRQIRQGERTTT